MNTPLRGSFAAMLVFGASSAFSAETKPPASPEHSVSPSKTFLAGDFTGTWQSMAGQAGKLHLNVKRAADAWTAEAAFTYQDQLIATTMKSVKIEGTKLEVILDWAIQGTPGQSKLIGELKGDQLQGAYESKSPTETTNGTWTAAHT